MSNRILIVEDEGLIALDLKRKLEKLEKLGYSVPVIVDNGADALALVERLTPDLVMMDIRLRGPQDGIETADQMRRRFQVPVLFLTAHADRDTLERAKLSEPFGYLVKPFQSVDLSIQVEIALSRAMELKNRGIESSSSDERVEVP